MFLDWLGQDAVGQGGWSRPLITTLLGRLLAAPALPRIQPGEIRVGLREDPEAPEEPNKPRTTVSTTGREWGRVEPLPSREEGSWVSCYSGVPLIPHCIKGLLTGTQACVFPSEQE